MSFRSQSPSSVIDFPKRTRLVTALAAASAWGLALTLGSARAQSPAPAATPDANALYTAAVGAFDRSDYQGAVTSIKALLGQIPPDLSPADKDRLTAQLEPIYFTLGAAYYNLRDWPSASAAFKDYLSKYPRGSRATEAKLSLAQAAFFAQDYPAAAAGFAALEDNPQTREQAILYEGLAYKESGNTDKAISELERLVAGGIRSNNAARAAMSLVGLYSAKKEPEKALKILSDLHANAGQVENPVELNAAALAQGDAFLEASDAKDALICYRAVLTRGEVLALLHERVANLQRRLDANKAAARANPRNASSFLLADKQIYDAVAETQNAAQAFEKQPDPRPKVLFRIGRAFALLGKPWEAIVVYTDLLDASKDPVDREPALFGLASAYTDADRPFDARETYDTYLKEFPKGANADAAGYLLGATALQQNDPKAAEGYFGRMLAAQPDSSMAGEMRFLLGNAEFAQSEYADAQKNYEKYLHDFPSGAHVEEACYRIVLGVLFSGDYDDAFKRVNDYLQRYPSGAFVADAKYRRALCLFAAQKNDEAIAACRDWLKQYPQDGERGEVLSLLGDAQAAAGRTDEALDSYTQSYKAATNDEVLGYSIQEAAKILQKRGDWPAIGAMFEAFVRERPDHPLVATAMNWIVRADTKAGKIDEAKQFLAANIKKFIDDPHRQGVEGLLDQLATLCARRKPASPASGTPGVSPTPAPSPAADPGAELDTLLGEAEKDQSPTARARILYAKAQLAHLLRKNDEAAADLQEIGTKFHPADLSAVLLGQAGDALLAAGKTDEAAPLFQQLLRVFPNSDVSDFGYNGLGEIALRQQKYDDALKIFNTGLDKSAAATKLKDLTLGKATALLGLGRYDEAKKLFEQVAATREWRGEATAASVYSLGEIEERQGRWAEANAYYQRVYVAYQRFLPWVAKAYLGSANSLEKLGKTQDAINTYRDTLRNQKLADLPETAEARRRLQALGAG
jgi:TolA-binding protein